MITRVNVVCRDVCKIMAPTRPEPRFVDSICDYCGSIDAIALENYLRNGVDAKWIEPPPGKMVTWVELSNGKQFSLNHLIDEPLTETDYNSLLEVLEASCGNLSVFIREINKYYE